MIQEEWRDVKGFEGRYMVSNYGKVYSCLRGRLLNPWQHSYGYLRVHLTAADGEDLIQYCHILAAEAFLEKPNDGKRYVVNHKDENPTNNFVGTAANNYKDSNLEWVTHKENIAYSRARHGEEWKEKGRQCYRPPEPVVAFKDGEVYKVYETVEAAHRDLHIDDSTIRRRLRDPNCKKYALPEFDFKFANQCEGLDRVV